MGIQLTHWFTRLFVLFVGFRFVLLNLSLCGNRSTKQMKKEWPEYSHKSSYYTCSLRVSFHGDLFRILRLIKLPTISLKKNIFICCSSSRPSKHLQDVLVKTNIFVLAMCLQDVFKTSSRRLQDVFKTSSRRFEDVF